MTTGKIRGRKMLAVVLGLLILASVFAGCEMDNRARIPDLDVTYVELTKGEREIAEASGAVVERFRLRPNPDTRYHLEVKCFEDGKEDLAASLTVTNLEDEDEIPLYVSYRAGSSAARNAFAWTLTFGGSRAQNDYAAAKNEASDSFTFGASREGFDLLPGGEAILCVVAGAGSGKTIPSWETVEWGGLSAEEKAAVLAPYHFVYLAVLRAESAA